MDVPCELVALPVVATIDIMMTAVATLVISCYHLWRVSDVLEDSGEPLLDWETLRGMRLHMHASYDMIRSNGMWHSAMLFSTAKMDIPWATWH